MRTAKRVIVAAALAVALATPVLPAAADDPTPSPTDSPTASPSPSPSPTPSPTDPTGTPTPKPSSPHPSHSPSHPAPSHSPANHPSPNPSATHRPGNANDKGHGKTHKSHKHDRYLIDVANDSLQQATRKARAAQAVADKAHNHSQRVKHELADATTALAAAEKAATHAHELVGEMARAMAEYNLSAASIANPDLVMWQAPLSAASPSEYVEQSVQLSQLAEGFPLRYAAAQRRLDAAQASEARVEQASAKAATSTAKADKAAHRATVAAHDAKQVFLRLSKGKQGSAQEAWWANDFASSDLGQYLAGLNGGPNVSLNFHQPGSGIVTSPYGMRMHPILHVYKLHSGIDYAVGDGKIRAADPGRVVRAGYDVAYGNYIVILHGQLGDRSVATLYAHSRALLVKQGQYVTTGQVIGLVGESGYATGPHLHFEVRLDGRPINPAPYVH